MNKIVTEDVEVAVQISTTELHTQIQPDRDNVGFMITYYL